MRIVPAEPKFEWDPDCASSLSTINAEGVQGTESYHPLPPSLPFHKVRTTATMYSRTLTMLTLFSLAIITLASPVPAPLAEAKVQTPAEDLEVRGTIEARANSGKGTWYNPSVGTGACGWNNKDSELVVALGPSKYNKAKKCGQSITVKSGSKSVKVKVVDLCPSCGGGSLDLSPAAFKKLAPLSKGVIQVNWVRRSAPPYESFGLMLRLTYAVIVTSLTFGWVVP
ncbi:Non-catalytic module family expn protein [Rhizoctonia solani]|uniref:Non-catalytic module family expn protein n=1 Tax=Rhizoctonia solani TaxID=456999 RepID=A0A8H7IAI7_9AGAM|nr:Non-catalytic module family expn protein [Rhizoctonia solani]